MRFPLRLPCALCVGVVLAELLGGCARAMPPSPSSAGFAAAPAETVAVEPLTVQGDAVRGQQLYESRCIACHSLDENRVGPMHK